MKHSVKSLLLTVLVALVSISASSHDLEVDGIYYNILSVSDLTCEVTYEGDYYGSAKYTGDVKIPSTVTYNGKTLSVTSIGERAFNMCENLSSIDIPNSVTSIGDCAFFYCTSLTTIDIPNSVTRIDDGAFYGCTSLTSIDIPNSVTSIGGCAFYGCTSLTSIDIPNSVTSIENYAFEGCTSLTYIDIPNSVTSIGMSAFKGCTSLTSIDIPNSVTSIGILSAFEGCTSLTQIEIGNSYAMKYILIYKNDITSLIISEDYSDKSIPTYYYNSYYGYSYIRSNENLKTFICKMATPVNLGDNFSDVQYMNLEVIVPTESLALYQAADVWKNFWNLKGGAENYMTGISNVTVDKANKPDVIYDLQGRKLSKPQKGINIINGKKVVVK